LQCARDTGQESPVEADHLQKCLQLLDERWTRKLLMAAMGGKWQLACRVYLEAKIVQLRDAPHTLLAVVDKPVLL
jgi:hypothetical protein